MFVHCKQFCQIANMTQVLLLAQRHPVLVMIFFLFILYTRRKDLSNTLTSDFINKRLMRKLVRKPATTTDKDHELLQCQGQCELNVKYCYESQQTCKNNPLPQSRHPQNLIVHIFPLTGIKHCIYQNRHQIFVQYKDIKHLIKEALGLDQM